MATIIDRSSTYPPSKLLESSSGHGNLQPSRSHPHNIQQAVDEFHISIAETRLLATRTLVITHHPSPSLSIVGLDAISVRLSITLENLICCCDVYALIISLNSIRVAVTIRGGLRCKIRYRTRTATDILSDLDVITKAGASVIRFQIR